MIKTLKDFFYYIFNPSYQNIQIKIPKKILFKKLFLLLILTIGFNGIIIITRTTLINNGIIPPLFFKNKGYTTGFWIYPLIVLLISPVVEELGFRLFFIPSRINIVISISILIYFLSYLIFTFNLFALNIYLIIPVVSFLILLFFTSKFSIIKQIQIFITKYYKVIFYISILFYTYIHLINFCLVKEHIIWLPFIFLPYLMLGFVLGYIRIKWGIKYSILFHLTYNIIPFLLSLFFVG